MFQENLFTSSSIRPEIGPKFLSKLGPNPTRKARPDLQLCIEHFGFKHYPAAHNYEVWCHWQFYQKKT